MTSIASRPTLPSRPPRESALTQALAELGAHGVAVIPHVLAEDEALGVRAALLFGYYCVDFLRPQTNFNVVLSEATKAQLSPELFALLGLGADGNTRVGGELIGDRRRPPGSTDAS